MSDDSRLIILNSTFEKNSADYAACINLENLGGIVIISSSLFLNNHILLLNNKTAGPGSASVVKLTGNRNTIVVLFKNQFLSNFQPNAGCVVNVGGRVYDYFSIYKGIFKVRYLFDLFFFIFF